MVNHLILSLFCTFIFNALKSGALRNNITSASIDGNNINHQFRFRALKIKEKSFKVIFTKRLILANFYAFESGILSEFLQNANCLVLLTSDDK